MGLVEPFENYGRLDEVLADMQTERRQDMR